MPVYFPVIVPGTPTRRDFVDANVSPQPDLNHAERRIKLPADRYGV
jgi:hypothetical protein